MAKRPIFIPQYQGKKFVKEEPIEFNWNPGFAPIQKVKNIAAMHENAAQHKLSPLLEVSTKSDTKLGVRLSAFNLRVELTNGDKIPLECAFQGSKVFKNGGPYHDIYYLDSKAAKKDSRIRDSGPITGFNFEGVLFPSTPRTAFYDWLYIRTLAPHREFLQRLEYYVGFTDIEFNPEKSLNCQARSCAIFVSLNKRNLLDEAARSPTKFISTVYPINDISSLG